MTALLEKEMERYADTAPLKVINPQPAAWSPPSADSKGNDGKATGKTADKPQNKTDATRKFER